MVMKFTVTELQNRYLLDSPLFDTNPDSPPSFLILAPNSQPLDIINFLFYRLPLLLYRETIFYYHNINQLFRWTCLRTPLDSTYFLNSIWDIGIITKFPIFHLRLNLRVKFPLYVQCQQLVLLLDIYLSTHTLRFIKILINNKLHLLK